MIYIISKLLTFFFLPPGIFIIALLLGAYFSKGYKKTLLFFTTLFYLFSNSYFSYYILSPLEKPFKKEIKTENKVDKIVILGGGNIKDSPNLPLRNDAFKRVIYGIMLSNSTNIPIIFTGGGNNKNYKESDSFIETVKELEKNLNIQIDYKVESKSLNTYENAKYTKKLLGKEGIKNPSVYLVTSAYHMRRAVMIFENFGFKVIPKATDFKAEKKDFSFLKILPNIGAFYNSYLALHEYIGFFKDYLLSRT